MFYRCSECKKPFIMTVSKFVDVSISSDIHFVSPHKNFSVISVSPCCNSRNYSELNDDFFTEFVDGKRKEMTVLSDGSVNEFVLQWAKDFVEMNEKAE